MAFSTQIPRHFWKAEVEPQHHTQITPWHPFLKFIHNDNSKYWCMDRKSNIDIYSSNMSTKWQIDRVGYDISNQSD